MRIVLATTNFALPRDLTEGYANVSIVALYTSYQALIEGLMAGSVEGREPVDVVVVDDELKAVEDREAGLALVDVLGRVRELCPAAKVIVMTRAAQEDDVTAKLGLERLIEHDPKSVAINLASMLKIPARSEIAQIIAVTGLQGGAGRTTMAQAIADTLSDKVRDGRGGVLLWELDLAHPTLAFDQELELTVGEHGRRTIARLLNASPLRGDEDMKTIRDSIISRDRSHLSYDLLLAPHGIREVMALYQAYPSLVELRNRISDLLAILARHYQAIVVDLPTALVGDPAAAVVLPQADQLAIMVTPCAAGLSSVMAMRAIVSDLHAEVKSKLIINRARQREDSLYLRHCQAQAQGAMDFVGTIADGAPASAFTALAGRLLEMGS